MYEGMLFEKVRKVKAKHLKDLMKIPNVVGVGIGEKLKQGLPTGGICLRVYVTKKVYKDDLGRDNLIPPSLEDIATDVVEIGQPIPYQYMGRNRPAVGGDSIGHFMVTAGTLGCLVRDKTDGSTGILSNNHILANKDAPGFPRASAGDCIVQPGILDGGTCATDQIATLKRWVQLIPQGSGTNLVDAALAQPINPGDVRNTIHDIGCISSWRSVSEVDVVSDPADPDNVQKTGRTTGYTTGKITDIDATVTINYGAYRADHEDVIATDSMGAPGDSGSLLVDMSGKAVGLLFGGSPGVVVFYSKIQHVLNALNIEFLPCGTVCLLGPIICRLGGPGSPCRLGGPIHCIVGGPDQPCRLGGPRDCFVGGPIHCIAGGPDQRCRTGGPIHCRIGGPDQPCLIGGPGQPCRLGGPIQCVVGGPDQPCPPGGGPGGLCVVGGPLTPECRAGGPIIPCKSGPQQCTAGPVVGCLAGPPLIEEIDPGKLVSGEMVIDLDRLSPEQRGLVAQLIKKLAGKGK